MKEIFLCLVPKCMLEVKKVCVYALNIEGSHFV